MKSFKKIFLASVVSITFCSGISTSFASETMGEKANEMGQDVKKASKKSVRAVKDKTCEMMNGKMECMAKKMGHKMENGADEVKDKVDDVKH